MCYKFNKVQRHGRVGYPAMYRIRAHTLGFQHGVKYGLADEPGNSHEMQNKGLGRVCGVETLVERHIRIRVQRRRP